MAGCEAAWQAARKGYNVHLYEMKPALFSPAHQSENLCELVCSNSFRSDDPTSAAGLLKKEMSTLGSLSIAVARKCAVPAGKALAVDRELFAREITRKIEENPFISVHREPVHHLPPADSAPTILATGPLTSESMADSLAAFTGKNRLSFYDAIAPIVETESLDMDIIYQKSRYDDGPGDYLNCPFTREQYDHFINEINNGECVPLHDFEKVKYFEGCLPIEVMSSRGKDVLRFGPMKPVGLTNPHTGEEPYAVVQLRKENMAASHYNLVGFQTKLTYREQKRIFTQIPGLEKAVFSRFGSIHRNTFICAPEVLEPTLQTKTRQDLFIAGQLSGVEGYIESAAMGLLAGINSARMLAGQKLVTPPDNTALGGLIAHLTRTEAKRFQPSNVTFGLFPPLPGKKVKKRLRGEIREKIATQSLQQWIEAEKL